MSKAESNQSRNEDALFCTCVIYEINKFSLIAIINEWSKISNILCVFGVPVQVANIIAL